MKFKYFIPSPALSDFIDYYFIIESSNDEEKFPTELYPSPSLEMTFTYGNPKTSYVTFGNQKPELAHDYSINGYSTCKSVYTNSSDLGVIMVGFKPWGIQHFLNFEVKDITNQSVDLKDIWSKKMRIIEDQLRDVNTDEERIIVIEEFLLSILQNRNQDKLLIQSIYQISNFNGNRTISDLAKSCHLSQKQYIRRFINTVGITPKLYSRIIRFQNIMNLLKMKNFKLLDVAFETGFFDQAHFIKEFKQFTNETPQSYINNHYSTELGEYFNSNTKKSIFYNTIYR